MGDDVYPDWEAVYRDNVDRVYGLMFAKVGNRADAEDLTAEVFLAALGPLRVSASVGEVRAYLSATARTVLAAHWRRHYGREITTLPELPDVAAPSAGTDQPGTDPPTGSPPGTATAELEAEGMLAELPERYAQVLRLRFLRGYTIRETANALDVTVANAKVLQHRALRRAAQLTGEAAR